MQEAIKGNNSLLTRPEINQIQCLCNESGKVEFSEIIKMSDIGPFSSFSICNVYYLQVLKGDNLVSFSKHLNY